MNWKFWRKPELSLPEIAERCKQYPEYWRSEGHDLDALELLYSSISRFEILAGIVKERDEPSLPKELKPAILSRKQILKRYGYPIPVNQCGFILHLKTMISFESGEFVGFMSALEQKTGKKFVHTIAMLAPQEFVWTFEVTNTSVEQKW